MSEFKKTKGLVINSRDFGEADKFIDVFTDEYGKISVTMKGIRKSKRREQCAGDILTLSNFVFYKKVDRFILSDFTLIDAYTEIKENYDDLEGALCVIGILNSLLTFDETNKKLFDVTLKILDVLKKNNNNKKKYLLIAYFLYYIIRIQGLGFDSNGKGQYFSITNSCFESLDEISSNDKRQLLDNNEKIVIIAISNNKVKDLLDNDDISISDIISMIYLYEKYINYHLDIHMQLKNFLMGATYDKFNKDNRLHE